MVTAMNIYQPSSFNGRLFKLVLPYLKRNRFLLSKLDIKEEQYSLDNHFRDLIEKYLGRSNIEFSIFLGTPSVHQKITMQISVGNEILGYCKITDRTDVNQLFQHEAQVLDELKKKGIRSIPACLFQGSLNEKIKVFLQSSTKTNSSKMIHKWDNRLWRFLEEMHAKTSVTLLFEETDFYCKLKSLSERLQFFPKNQADILDSALTTVHNSYAGQTLLFSIYHADFTPWNMYFEKNELFVFDFEYALRTCPPFLDYFHFFTQTRIFEQKQDENAIHKAYKRHKIDLSEHFSNADLSYISYLLLVIAIYAGREKAENIYLIPTLTVWIGLIKKLINQKSI